MGAESTWVQLNQDRYPGVSVEVAVLDGRVRIVGVRRPVGLRADDLRSVPVSRLEARWNDPSDMGGKLVRRRLQLGIQPEAPKPPTRRELKIAIPEGKRYPDGFYARVAILYHALVANGLKPAPAIAEANKVPESTVHRWVREARNRGFMAKEPGRGRTG